MADSYIDPTREAFDLFKQLPRAAPTLTCIRVIFGIDGIFIKAQ